MNDIVNLDKQREKKQEQDKESNEKALTKRFQKAMGLDKKKWPKAELKKRKKPKRKK